MARLTLAQMKAKSTDYFFSPNTMRMYKGSKYKTKYDKKTGKNYLKVISKHGTANYEFNDKAGQFINM